MTDVCEVGSGVGDGGCRTLLWAQGVNVCMRGCGNYVPRERERERERERGSVCCGDVW